MAWESRIIIRRPIEIRALVSAFTAERGKEYVFQGEVHNFWEMVYVKEGMAGFTADGQVFECPPETVVFHKPNEFHRIWTAGDEPLQFTVISFDTDSQYLSDQLSNAVITLSSKSRALMAELQSIIENSGAPNAYLPGDFRCGGSVVDVARFCGTLELLLYECAASHQKVAPKNSSSARLFAAAVRKMNGYISQPIKSQQLADELNISLAHLKRIFNRYALTGVHEYFLAIKIKKAKALLSQGEPVYKVAEEVGFDNPNYFSATFKRETDLSPTQWVKRAE